MNTGYDLLAVCHLCAKKRLNFLGWFRSQPLENSEVSSVSKQNYIRLFQGARIVVGSERCG